MSSSSPSSSSSSPAPPTTTPIASLLAASPVSAGSSPAPLVDFRLRHLNPVVQLFLSQVLEKNPSLTVDKINHLVAWGGSVDKKLGGERADDFNRSREADTKRRLELGREKELPVSLPRGNIEHNIECVLSFAPLETENREMFKSSKTGLVCATGIAFKIVESTLNTLGVRVDDSLRAIDTWSLNDSDEKGELYAPPTKAMQAAETAAFRLHHVNSKRQADLQLVSGRLAQDVCKPTGGAASSGDTIVNVTAIANQLALLVTEFTDKASGQSSPVAMALDSVSIFFIISGDPRCPARLVINLGHLSLAFSKFLSVQQHFVIKQLYPVMAFVAQVRTGNFQKLPFEGLPLGKLLARGNASPLLCTLADGTLGSPSQKGGEWRVDAIMLCCVLCVVFVCYVLCVVCCLCLLCVMCVC